MYSRHLPHLRHLPALLLCLLRRRRLHSPDDFPRRAVQPDLHLEIRIGAYGRQLGKHIPDGIIKDVLVKML